MAHHLKTARAHPRRIWCNGEPFRLYLPEKEIRRRVRELGLEISRDYAGKVPILIGVLNGSFIFISDLMRALKIDCEVDFLKLSSYGDAKVSSGQVTVRKGLDADIRARDVLIVEDIVDTGLSVRYLCDLIEAHKPASLRVATLLHKAEATRYAVQLDYVGFVIPNLFVIGYGLDYAQKGRNLRHLYILDR
ncbi:MAG: hypoxanthine phosphoribosyltransferase [Bacteroidetes bacterium]|nr:hypoxanthine phosphoribosyltransferase [Rhodothermia bacterium]MCS7155201.1 hypoxanthine phosphoribosyltransferase [Bacteroidota bacterium]MCX7907786.1 hypoxanthine phosphoribosyltransferase [Bacteroidota bacterium]MDW8138605.1 hypoxanthine phosphoribosyltransferase [Bacteroidota bacterium]MDW8284809.1 hypoxanthine phosphoribosyltransferase [Bacteroidota bacterium]